MDVGYNVLSEPGLTRRKTSDGQKRMIICEWGLRVKSQYSWATVADLT